jgi:hypothetical protein
MGDIFVSHVEEDADVALAIALGLEQARYRTWCYEVDSKPGVSYLIQTGLAVEQCKAIIVVISPHALASRQVTSEIVRAHETGKQFLPVLRGVSHVEFQARQPEWREAFGAATSISVAPGDVADVVARLAAGLSALGIQPSRRTRTEQAVRLRKALERLPTVPATAAREPRHPLRQSQARPRGRCHRRPLARPAAAGCFWLSA